jgi:beta-mannanase
MKVAQKILSLILIAGCIHPGFVCAHVPVLWRPYHEMNGDWSWWGGRTREYRNLPEDGHNLHID